jgi:hypothetical protein
MLIAITEFPTHLAKTNNKYKANKMQKLNYQSIYNGSLNRFGRANVMNNMHDYLIDKLEPYREKFLEENISFPAAVHLEIHTVINHGDISMRSGKVCWKPAPEDYEPSWDIDNLSGIWMKGLKDSLVLAKLIPDDNVKYINYGAYSFVQVDDISQRKLLIKIE